MSYSDPIKAQTTLLSSAPLFAGVQMTSQGSVAHCLEVASKAIALAAKENAHVVVLPENFATLGTGASAAVAKTEAVNEAQPILQWCRHQALINQVFLVAGTVPVWQPASGLSRARLRVFNPQGDLICHYDKIHLFDADVTDLQGQYRESEHYESGSQVVCWDLPLPSGNHLKIGVAVCYDLRFPELFRHLRDQQVEVVLLPSAFTHSTGAAHWELLLRARAVEQGLFVLGVNQCGWHDDKRQTWGHSVWVTPWGELQGGLNEDSGIVLGRYDAALIARCRQQLPTHLHRRLL